MKQVVKKENGSLVFDDGGYIFCDSRMVADKFGVDHRNVVRTAERIIGKIDKVKVVNLTGSNRNSPTFIKQEFEYRGQKFRYYQMNKSGFMMLAMRFETDMAFSWQLRFVDAFEKMESEILRLQSIIANNRTDPKWLETRTEGKEVRLSFTDTINRYKDYAKSQGSTHFGMLFMSLSKMINSSLFDVSVKCKNLRELLDVPQLKHVATAEFLTEIAIEAGMEAGLHYKKEINPMCKAKVESFATRVGRTPVPRASQFLGSAQRSLIGMEAAQ
jgi:Rha family phage regulatory protein